MHRVPRRVSTAVGIPANTHLIVKADRMKLGSVVIPWIGRKRHDDLRSLVIKEGGGEACKRVNHC